MLFRSASLEFGSGERLKGESAAEVAGMLAYAAAMSGDKTGLLLFSEQVEKVLPLRKGKNHVSRILRELIEHRPRARGTGISAALETAGRVMKHKGIVIVVSDFIDEQYEISLRRLARRHDVVAIRVGDQREQLVPDSGQFPVLDPESGIETYIDTGSYAFKQWFEGWLRERETTLEDTFRKARVEQLETIKVRCKMNRDQSTMQREAPSWTANGADPRPIHPRGRQSRRAALQAHRAALEHPRQSVGAPEQARREPQLDRRQRDAPALPTEPMGSQVERPRARRRRSWPLAAEDGPDPREQLVAPEGLADEEIGRAHV